MWSVVASRKRLAPPAQHSNTVARALAGTWYGHGSQMEQSPVIPVKFHIRMISLMSVLALTDIFFVNYTVDHLLTRGVSVMVMFGFEVRVVRWLQKGSGKAHPAPPFLRAPLAPARFSPVSVVRPRSQYAVQLASLVGTAVKYVLHTIDLRDENPWENKSMYIFYLELIVGACPTTLPSTARPPARPLTRSLLPLHGRM